MGEDLKHVILAESKRVHDKVVEWRRDFHSHPELGYEEVRTASIVEGVLKSLGYNVERVAKTGVIGTLRGGGGPVVGLRADMDALPINEENDVPYRSIYPGRMHACGHDAHTAMLLGAAVILSKLRPRLRGTVKLIFQPAEEIGTGAKDIVESGAVDDVEAFFGVHVFPFLPKGLLATKQGPLLASCDDYRIVIRGKGGHPSSPHEAVDPIAPALQIASTIRALPSLEVDPLEPSVVAVTSVRAGNTYNVIPETAEIMGTVRALSEKTRSLLLSRIKEVSVSIASAMRCRAEFELLQSMPVTINDVELAGLSREWLSPLKVIELPKPFMGSEDFSFYSKVGRTLYMALGVGNKEKGIVYPNHHPRFDIDEDALWVGVAAYTMMAFALTDYLSKK